MIYSVDIASQERKEITQGVDFTISNDGGYLAAVVPVKNEEDPEALNYAVTIKNLDGSGTGRGYFKCQRREPWLWGG